MTWITQFTSDQSIRFPITHTQIYETRCESLSRASEPRLHQRPNRVHALLAIQINTVVLFVQIDRNRLSKMDSHYRRDEFTRCGDNYTRLIDVDASEHILVVRSRVIRGVNLMNLVPIMAGNWKKKKNPSKLFNESVFQLAYLHFHTCNNIEYVASLNNRNATRISENSKIESIISA